LLSAVGWLVNHAITGRSDHRRQQLVWQLAFASEQLEQLYGPLAFLITEGEQTFRDLLKKLGRNYVFFGDNPLPPEELKTWLFWAENDFLPRNRQIQALLASKSHLIEGAKIPDSHIEFLKHYSSWELAQKEQGAEYNWHSEVYWPRSFEYDVLTTFAQFKQRHAALLGRLGNEGKSRPR
jgi:hypothetical protein